MMRKVACLIPSHHDLEEEEGASEKCVARYCSSSSPFLDRISSSKGFFGQGGLQSKEDVNLSSEGMCGSFVSETQLTEVLSEKENGGQEDCFP